MTLVISFIVLVVQVQWLNNVYTGKLSAQEVNIKGQKNPVFLYGKIFKLKSFEYYPKFQLSLTFLLWVFREGGWLLGNDQCLVFFLGPSLLWPYFTLFFSKFSWSSSSREQHLNGHGYHLSPQSPGNIKSKWSVCFVNQWGVLGILENSPFKIHFSCIVVAVSMPVSSMLQFLSF